MYPNPSCEPLPLQRRTVLASCSLLSPPMSRPASPLSKMAQPDDTSLAPAATTATRTAMSAPPTFTDSAAQAEMAPLHSGNPRDSAASSGSLRDTDGVHPAAVPAATSVATSTPSPPVDAAGPTVPGPSGHQKASARTPDPPKCPMCDSGGKGSRNLVVCIDGTSNQFSKKNTNVVELYSRLLKDDTQLTCYNSGIGTYAKPSWKSLSYCKQVIANKLDLAFALRFEKIIISAYAWLVDNYRKGDRIFLFGFSRGAYQVRALSAMIDTVGLLHKGNNDQIPFAYELYAASAAEEAPVTLMRRLIQVSWVQRVVSSTEPLRRKLHDELAKALPRKKDRSVTDIERDAAPSVPFPASRWRGKLRKVLDKMRAEKPRPIIRPKPQAAEESSDWDHFTLQMRFRETFSRRISVHFVGAWDTVSSIGFVRDKTLPGTTDGMQSACYFRHALALHEHRVKFLPEYANGGDGPEEDCTRSQRGRPPQTKEVWFTGSHSDIGGGSSANRRLDQFGPSLRWMSREATIAGLKFEDRRRKWVAGRVSQSMTPIWRFVECLPIKRLSYRGQHSVSWWPHLCADRRILNGQLLHETVYEECDVAGLPDFVKMEPDEYTRAKPLVISNPAERWETGTLWSAADLSRLETLLSSEAATQTFDDLAGQIYRAISDMVRFCRQHQVTDPVRAKDIMEELSLFHDRVAYRSFDLQDRMVPLSKILGTAPADTYATHPFFHGHTQDIRSVAFLSPQLVVSGSYDDTLRVCNFKTGEAIGDPLTGHTDDVFCVAVSPDGNLVASGSGDKTVRTWKFNAGTFVGEGLIMQADGMGDVFSVAFSPNGQHIVSGSDDRALRVWDSSTGQQIGNTMQGHGGWVWSVAFSSDGARIVSGSEDQTVRLWDAEMFRPLGEPLTGHTETVVSVAFSPDGAFIASGSWDWTVRIWNSDSRQLMHTLQGHSYLVWSVAFSPSGRHIATASGDKTVRIWDALKGEAVGVLKGHSDEVSSVAFSPDGTRIASGSWDQTVRIWDRICMSSPGTT